MSLTETETIGQSRFTRECVENSRRYGWLWLTARNTAAVALGWPYPASATYENASRSKKPPIDNVIDRAAITIASWIHGDAFDPNQFVDEEKQRILAAVEKKIAGKEIVAPRQVEAGGAEVIDLMAALRASLSGAGSARTSKQAVVAPEKANSSRERKPARRAAKSIERATPRKVSAKK